jgi:hypothetical protein
LLNLRLDALFVVQLQKMGYFAFIDRHLQEDKGRRQSDFDRRPGGPENPALPSPHPFAGEEEDPAYAIVFYR